MTQSRPSSAPRRGGRAPGSPDDLDWLATAVRRSPLVADPSLRQHWLTVLPWLEAAGRYQLAAALLATEQRLARPCPA